MTSVGLCARSCSNEHPHASILPGPMFSMTTSARPANDRNMSRPSGAAISMLILRMLRVSPANNAVVRTPDGSNSSNWLGASKVRSASGRSFHSILITSAPSSARTRGHTLPATTVPNERTRTPWSKGGCVGSNETIGPPTFQITYRMSQLVHVQVLIRFPEMRSRPVVGDERWLRQKRRSGHVEGPGSLSG